jgi:hypothetical protein
MSFVVESVMPDARRDGCRCNCGNFVMDTLN